MPSANRIGGVIVSMLASSAEDRRFDPRWGSNHRLCNCYLLLLRYARIIREKVQRLVGLE